MNNHDYLEQKLNELKSIVNPHNYFFDNRTRDEDIKTVRKELEKYWWIEYQNVNSKEKIYFYLESLKTVINRIEKDWKNRNEVQYITIMKHLYDVIKSIEKAVNCYDSPGCKFDFTVKEIDELFKEINSLVIKKDNIGMMRSARD